MLPLLPNEINIKIASYLSLSDLKAYSLASKQSRAYALEHLIFHTRGDDESVQNSLTAGARKLSLDLKCVDILTMDSVVLDKIVKLKTRTFAQRCMQVLKNLQVLNVYNCRLR